MKSIRNVFDQIFSFENLYSAYLKARRGKRYREYACAFEWRLEENLFRLQYELSDGSYQPGAYKTHYISEPKRRLISAAPFRDRIVHHALIDVIEPIFDKSLIEDTYACRLNKGTHRALDRCQGFLRQYDWALQCDIQKYFPSIDHAILLEMLGQRIRDEATMKLLKKIVSNSNPQDDVLHWFPDDDLLAPCERRRGLPIGNLTSQFFANFYLNGLDHFIKQDLGCHGYLRYMDDFIIFGDSKKELTAIRQGIIAFLERLRLKLHPKKRNIFPEKNGVPFLGFHIFRTRRRLKRGNVMRFRRRVRLLLRQIVVGELSYGAFGERLKAWIAHAAHGDTYRLRKEMFKKIIIIKTARQRAS